MKDLAITCADCGEVYYSSVQHLCPGKTLDRLEALEKRCATLEAVVDHVAKNTGTTVEEILQRVAEDVP
jgi:hypothetical protein